MKKTDEYRSIHSNSVVILHWLIIYFVAAILYWGCNDKPKQHAPFSLNNSDRSASKFSKKSINNTLPKDALSQIYTQAIADYIRLVKKEYGLSFDTLFFGKHANGQTTDFPDVVLPNTIEQTNIKLLIPKQGEKQQLQDKNNYYINLIGTADHHKADFIFIAFSNGFAHQFDCFITYHYGTEKKKFVIASTRFERYENKISE